MAGEGLPIVRDVATLQRIAFVELRIIPRDCGPLARSLMVRSVASATRLEPWGAMVASSFEMPPDFAPFATASPSLGLLGCARLLRMRIEGVQRG
jgi:hypothetical protein